MPLTGEDERAHPLLTRCFGWLVARRHWVVAFYALLLGPAIYFAVSVEQDNGIERLIVETDPEFITAKAFAKVFGSSEYAVLIVEAPEPFAPEALSKFARLESELGAVPKVSTHSALGVFRRARAGFEPTAQSAAAFRQFVHGSDLLSKQAPIGDGFMGIPIVMDVHSSKERSEVLGAVDRVIERLRPELAPITAVRKIGLPYVYEYLDHDTRVSGIIYFSLFALFVIALVSSLYRSWRTLVAFMVALATSVALTVGFIGATGGVFTIVSSLVPMTILITCTSSLVYIHSRFVECPPGRDPWAHQLFSLGNKFLACTASIFATAVGFAALAVSEIRPIREMGLWVAIGLVFTWLVVFTLFPALQRILQAPTKQEREVAGRGMERLAAFIPGFSYRYRWVLVPTSLLLSAMGAVALFGIPGVLSPMQMQIDAIEYINPKSSLYQDTKRFERAIGGLSVADVWLKGKLGSLTEPAVIRGLHRFQESIGKDPDVGAVIGPASLLRTLRYVSGRGDELPASDAELEAMLDTLETLLPREPMLQRFIESPNLAQTHLSVVTKTLDYPGFQKLEALLLRKWQAALATDPALAVFEFEVAGLAPLQAKIGFHLVPTLVESFGLTVVVIFTTFLLVFRNGAARIMAMIPSLFAILVMFLIMRLFGMSLNVATILIASTVLGTSENDQIHFFYHYQEKQKTGASTEAALRHTLRIAGRAIFFATLINAGGFLAFALADLPPMRQFGILSALAFMLSMIADFTALPAALWLVFRDRPEASKTFRD